MADATDRIPYRMQTSDRARRVRVTVDPRGEVLVVVPASVARRRHGESMRAAEAAVAELRPWIDRRRTEALRARAEIAARGDTVPYLGEFLTLVPEPDRTRVHRRGDVLLVPGGDGPPQRAARIAAIERWYRRAARGEIAARLDAACAAVGRSYTGLTIRGQRTRWASCSGAGAMSFNWRLLLAPKAVVDYVVWHEVCHLDVMDHSPRFWALLSLRCPHHPEHAAWLRRHGATLRLDP